MSELSEEDAKLVVLARAARLRAYMPTGGSAGGAAVRDTDGRTYAGATVDHEDYELAISALMAAVAAASSSGARSFEAAAVVGARPSFRDLLVLGQFGSGVPVLVASAEGVVQERLTT